MYAKIKGSVKYKHTIFMGIYAGYGDSQTKSYTMNK